MMPPYRLAHLSDGQMMAIEQLENEIGVTLIAYEPMCDAVRENAATQYAGDADDDLVSDALLDTYRTYDPLH